MCFGSCESDCPVAGLVDVTFTLDVNNNDVNFNPLCDNYLIGSFQQPFPWDIDIFPIPLANMGNGIYETTVSLLSGTNIEYKFANCLSNDSFIENDIDIKITKGTINLRISRNNVPKNSDSTIILGKKNEHGIAKRNPINMKSDIFFSISPSQPNTF